MARWIRLFLAAALLIVAAPHAISAPCVPGTLQDYINLGSIGCEIDGARVSDFEDFGSPNGGIPFDPTTIQVTPVDQLTAASLVFTLNAAAANGDLLDSLYHFTVTALAGRAISGADSSLAGAAATGDGAVTLIQQMCLDAMFLPPFALFCGGVEMDMILFATAFDNQLADAVRFVPPPPGPAFVDVVVDFGVDAGLTGTATLQSATIRFSTPASSALALLALALTLLASSARRRRTRS
jgi:hypothetical protein